MLALNHCLVEGNKWADWATDAVILDRNGYPLAEPLDEDRAE